MTREEAITKAVRKWWHIFNQERWAIDVRCVGATMRSMERQRLFVRCVRESFKQIANLEGPLD